jgi:hypothetical protein
MPTVRERQIGSSFYIRSGSSLKFFLRKPKWYFAFPVSSQQGHDFENFRLSTCAPINSRAPIPATIGSAGTQSCSRCRLANRHKIPQPNMAKQVRRRCFRRYGGTKATIPIAAEASRKTDSNFSDRWSSEVTPANVRIRGPATQCMKQRDAMTIPARSRFELTARMLSISMNSQTRCQSAAVCRFL